MTAPTSLHQIDVQEEIYLPSAINKIYVECAERMLADLRKVYKDDFDKFAGVALLNDIKEEFLRGGVFVDRPSSAFCTSAVNKALPLPLQYDLDDIRDHLKQHGHEASYFDTDPDPRTQDIYLKAADWKLDQIKKLIEEQPAVLQNEKLVNSFLNDVRDLVAHGDRQASSVLSSERKPMPGRIRQNIESINAAFVPNVA